MRKPFRNLLATALLTTALAGTSNFAAAGELFGTSTQWKFIHVSQFQIIGTQCGWTYYSYGYETITAMPGGTCTGAQIRANVDIPEGATLAGFYTFYFSNGSSITTQLYHFDSSLNNGTTPTYSSVGPGATTPATSGYGVHYQTLYNGTAFPVYKTWDPSSGGGSERDYQFVTGIPNTGTAFKGIAIVYLRQVAPAPATASFTDVPSGAPFFNEVEQLKKSGITLGCGGGNFCPDSPVTRGQMAAFLSRALGLNWDFSTNAP